MRPRCGVARGAAPGEGEPRREGPANGGREVAGAPAKPRKSRSRAQHTFKCKQPAKACRPSPSRGARPSVLESLAAHLVE